MIDKLLVMTGDQVTCAIEAIYSDAVDRLGMPLVDGTQPRWESMLRKAGAPHDVELDPLHARARTAIERLGLDGSRLETAVSVFGWGSDEANGSLLGMARLAWDGHDIQVTVLDDGRPVLEVQDGSWTAWECWGADLLEDAYVRCIEARAQ